MVTHSSTLAWRIPWTEQPGGLQSIGLLRVRNDWSNFALKHVKLHNIATSVTWSYLIYFSRSPYILFSCSERVPVNQDEACLVSSSLADERCHLHMVHSTAINAPTGPSLTLKVLSDASCSALHPCCNSLKLCFAPAFCLLQWAERALLLGSTVIMRSECSAQKQLLIAH